MVLFVALLVVARALVTDFDGAGGFLRGLAEMHGVVSATAVVGSQDIAGAWWPETLAREAFEDVKAEFTGDDEG